MKNFTTKKLARAGVIAGLYVGLTLIFLPFSFGGIQIRLAEGLTFLPIFFTESIFSLFVGCALVNLFSAFGIVDVVIGSLTTLIAGVLTRIIYKKTNNLFLAGLPPVVLNALLIPLVIYLSGVVEGYFLNMLSIFISQSIFVYGVGIPLSLFLKKQEAKGSKLFKF